MKSYIHDYDRNLEREIECLKSSTVSAQNKKTILEFYRYNYSRDLSKARLMRQINSLKYTAFFLKKGFNKATPKDMQDYIAHRKELGRSQATIDTDKKGEFTYKDMTTTCPPEEECQVRAKAEGYYTYETKTMLEKGINEVTIKLVKE